MNAPDKIYLERIPGPEEDYYCEVADEEHGHVCYIRKDAILDFLQSEKQEAAQCSTGAYNWICEIIDKVNLL